MVCAVSVLVKPRTLAPVQVERIPTTSTMRRWIPRFCSMHQNSISQGRTVLTTKVSEGSSFGRCQRRKFHRVSSAETTASSLSRLAWRSRGGVSTASGRQKMAKELSGIGHQDRFRPEGASRNPGKPESTLRIDVVHKLSRRRR